MDAEGLRLATFGAGCFWCTEAAFGELKGVEKVEPGYSGGKVAAPTYEQVCTGETGHAEVCRVTFDPSAIGFRDLLDVFFSIHDPTTADRQGADVGAQYRSVVFFHDDEQRRVALEAIGELEASNAWPGPIVTQVAPFEAFYPAEGYHKDYFRTNPQQPYCRAVIAPKVMKLRKSHPDLLKGR
ncbi:MAG: peptide-methionine (S)-S-oxide reductase MsrA [Nitrososphaerota archaeon]|nr:peptide-methionine (S)-S-oxide reductase MsrA [Nitrososphaerota archaeon]MDG6938837.1 peptide-methionine (S)-S-oxide reductase MsrA [Nitrososphaerota archaeon]